MSEHREREAMYQQQLSSLKDAFKDMTAEREVRLLEAGGRRLEKEAGHWIKISSGLQISVQAAFAMLGERKEEDSERSHQLKELRGELEAAEAEVGKLRRLQAEAETELEGSRATIAGLRVRCVPRRGGRDGGHDLDSALKPPCPYAFCTFGTPNADIEKLDKIKNNK